MTDKELREAWAAHKLWHNSDGKEGVEDKRYSGFWVEPYGFYHCTTGNLDVTRRPNQ